MDQIYLPKIRTGFPAGQFVLIQPIENKLKSKNNTRQKNSLVFYNIKNLEQIKMQIIEKVFNIIENQNPENIIITGSFLEEGFNFNDLDILVIGEREFVDLKKQIEKQIGIPTHIIQMNNKTLISGISSDPLYPMMLSKAVMKKKIIFNVKRKLNYKLLDLNLLKSKTLFDNFELLNGKEKYYFTLNLISILLFIKGEKLSKEIVNKEIEKSFNIKIKQIKENILNKDFLNKYKKIYNKTFNLILNKVKNE